MNAILWVALALPMLAANLWAVIFLCRFGKPIVDGVRRGALREIRWPLQRTRTYNGQLGQMVHTLKLRAAGQL